MAAKWLPLDYCRYGLAGTTLFGLMGGSKGGLAAAARMTPEERSARARKASLARTKAGIARGRVKAWQTRRRNAARRRASV